MPDPAPDHLRDADLRQRVYEYAVVPFPYEWVTANGGERRLVKYIGLTEEQKRGEQGQPLKVGKKI